MILTKTAYVLITKLRILQCNFIVTKLHKSDLKVYKSMDKQLRKFVFNKNYCNSTNVLGVVLSTKNSFQDDSKQPQLEQDAEILGPYFQENIEREIVKRIVIAKNALDEKKTEKAEKALEKAIDLGEKSNGLPLGLTCAYEMLATIACGKGDIIKAENLVISALRKFKTVNYTCSDNIVISFSMKLARLYKEANKVEAAEEIFRKCLDAQEKKYYKGHTDAETAQLWVNTLFWYGKLLVERNRYQEAVKCFETCYHLSCQVKSIQIPQVMVILHNLAESAYFTGDKDKALRYLKHAIMIGRIVNFPDLPVFYIRIGNIYTQKGEYQEAKIWCEGGKKLSKAIKNKNQEAEADTALKEIDRRKEQVRKERKQKYRRKSNKVRQNVYKFGAIKDIDTNNKREEGEKKGKRGAKSSHQRPIPMTAITPEDEREGLGDRTPKPGVKGSLNKKEIIEISDEEEAEEQSGKGGCTMYNRKCCTQDLILKRCGYVKLTTITTLLRA